MATKLLSVTVSLFFFLRYISFSYYRIFSISLTSVCGISNVINKSLDLICVINQYL